MIEIKDLPKEDILKFAINRMKLRIGKDEDKPLLNDIDLGAIGEMAYLIQKVLNEDVGRETSTI